MTDPYPMKARIRAEAGTTRIDVYDDIGDNAWGPGGLTAAGFGAKISSIQGPLDVHINSSGGNVDDGIAIANAIRAYPGPKRTVVDGMACSIASVIMQAGDERIMQPGSMVMIHEASVGGGTAADYEKTSNALKKHTENLADQYAQRAGGSPDQWLAAMAQETWYTADEAVAAGLADRVGVGSAALPRSLDLAAFGAVPGRIVAHLRTMPTVPLNADAAPDITPDGTHEPFTGTHTHPHAAMGDGDGSHEHEHTHDGDGDHGHTHPNAHTHTRIRAAYQPQPYEREDWENVQCPVCGKYNDNDGVYCGHCGIMLAGRDDISGAPSTPAGDGDMDASASAAVRALLAAGMNLDELLAFANTASIDESDWDGPHAMSLAAKSDDPAATYKSICAGRRDGDPSTQDSWALPYKYPGKGPNAAGVKNALGRLPQTQGLTNQAEAKALLQRLMKQINPDYQPDAHTDLPAWLNIHHDTAPPLPAWLDTP